MVTLAFNEKFGQALPMLSDQQIVHNVGFTPTGATSYFRRSALRNCSRAVDACSRLCRFWRPGLRHAKEGEEVSSSLERSIS